jgi:hypothetical protein
MKKEIATGLLMGAVMFSGCESYTLDYTAAEPPVTANTPAGLKSTTTSSMLNKATYTNDEITTNDSSITVSNLIAVVKERLFSDTGPNSAKKVLAALDDRMEELAERVSNQTCMGDDLTEVAFENLPNDATFTQKLQCYEDLSGESSSAWLAFGMDTDNSVGYVREGDTTSGMASAAKVTENGDNVDVEAWMIVTDATEPSNGSSTMQVKSTGSTGEIEFTVTGTGSGFCSAQYKSNADYLYIEGRFSEHEVSGYVYDCDDVEDTFVLCLSASDLSEADVSECQSANLNDFELTAITEDYSVTDMQTAGMATITGSGLRDFSEGTSE